MKKIRFLFLFIILALMPISASAATRHFKDVTVKKTNKETFIAVDYLCRHHGYKGITKVGTKYRLYPSKKPSGKEVYKMTRNLYKDFQSFGTSATISEQAYCNQFKKYAKNEYGISIRWTANHPRKKLTRATAAQYLYNFATFKDADGIVFPLVQ